MSDSRFYGNEAAQKLLARTLESKRLGHAYLFYGNDGLGKKTFAQLFAKSVMCKGPSYACGECSACRKIDAGIHPDVKWYLGGAAKGSVHIETIREIRSDCAVKPNESQWKIYIITNIQNMTTGAFNAFLKTLEEPPQDVLFLLTAPNLASVPETIVSRVIPVQLYPLPLSVMEQALQDRFPDAEPSRRAEAAKLAQGNLGYGIQILTEEGFAARMEELKRVCAAVSMKKEYELLVLFGRYEKDKPGLGALLEQLISVLRESLLEKAGVAPDTSQVGQMAHQLAVSLTRLQIMELIEFLEQGCGKLETNSHGGMMAAYLCAGIYQRILF